MKGTGLSSLLLLATLSAAWPWQGSYDDISGLVLRRQNNDNSNSDTASASTTKTSVDTSTITGTNDANVPASLLSSINSAAATTGGSGAAATTTASHSGNQFGNSSTSAHSSKTTAIDPRLPPGGIEMVTPGLFAAASYYKIGQYITFAWNYTSLSVTPTAIDVMASCALNSQLYTIAMNQSVEPTGAVTWDTGEYQATATIPLLTETYTLVIYDANSDVTATAQAGYLAVQDTFTFGMYSPQPYTPLNEFKCATCSAALSDHERQALGLMLGMSVITLLSFTWFAGGFGVFS